MPHTTPIDIIKERQRRWAQRSGRSLDDKGYCGCTDDNMFQPLSDAARRDFERGGGDALDGKICAVHSSSALACNWFDYWRERDFDVLSTAFGVSEPFVTLQLEAHVPTGMRGADANLDVLLTTASGWLFDRSSWIASRSSSALGSSPGLPAAVAICGCRNCCASWIVICAPLADAAPTGVAV